jgi:hypothetical protein
MTNRAVLIFAATATLCLGLGYVAGERHERAEEDKVPADIKELRAKPYPPANCLGRDPCTTTLTFTPKLSKDVQVPNGKEVPCSKISTDQEPSPTAGRYILFPPDTHCYDTTYSKQVPCPKPK